MSKFDAALKKIEEQLPMVGAPQQNPPPKPLTGQELLNQQELIKAIVAAKSDQEAQAILQTLTNPQKDQQDQQKPVVSGQAAV